MTKPLKIKAVDLFCGAGGLTHGLEKAGIDVVTGVDLDPHCKYPFEANNTAKFLLKSVDDVSADEIASCFKGADISVLAGCAPCQPFSTYSQGRDSGNDGRWYLLQHFSRLVESLLPDIVTMENVPGLCKQDVFEGFVTDLRECGYQVSYKVVSCAEYGVAQKRQRLVLLASRLGEITLIKPLRKPAKYETVRDALSGLPELQAGQVDEFDPMHQSCSLSPLNLERIRASKPGGTWRDWDEHLVADCHKKKSGKSYSGVYGRMTWDEIGPTVTTQFYGFGNGRFGHPEQDRALSLREGAILQSFPRSYKFVRKGEPIFRSSIGRLIGNAVPVKLGQAIGKSIMRHVEDVKLSKGRAV
jgi:DNA (cytosine-5)-methyltransferase 1